MEKIASILFGLKFTLIKPRSADILLYDQGVRFNFLFIKSFKNLKFEIFYKRYEKINLYILLLVIFKGGIKNIKQNYLITYVKIVNPKIIVTSNDVDVKFYTIKNYFKHIKVIAIQRSFKENDYRNRKSNSLLPESGKWLFGNESTFRSNRKN